MQQIIDAVVCNARGKQGCNRVGLAAVLPVRASAGPYSELKGSAVANTTGNRTNAKTIGVLLLERCSSP
jgi:hypothetical protein